MYNKGFNPIVGETITAEFISRKIPDADVFGSLYGLSLSSIEPTNATYNRGANDVSNVVYEIVPAYGTTIPPVEDLVPPVITITNSVSYDLDIDNGVKVFGDLILDAGITAIDDVDGDVVANLVYGVGGTSYLAIDLIPMVLGTMAITVDVSDTAGNPATQGTVNVEVTQIPQTVGNPPVITITTPAITYAEGTLKTFTQLNTECGITVSDVEDGTSEAILTYSLRGVNYVATDSVPTNTVGENIISVIATDSDMNVTTETINMTINEVVTYDDMLPAGTDMSNCTFNNGAAFDLQVDMTVDMILDVGEGVVLYPYQGSYNDTKYNKSFSGGVEVGIGNPVVSITMTKLNDTQYKVTKLIIAYLVDKKPDLVTFSLFSTSGTGQNDSTKVGSWEVDTSQVVFPDEFNNTYQTMTIENVPTNNVIGTTHDMISTYNMELNKSRNENEDVDSLNQTYSTTSTYDIGKPSVRALRGGVDITKPITTGDYLEFPAYMTEGWSSARSGEKRPIYISYDVGNEPDQLIIPVYRDGTLSKYLGSFVQDLTTITFPANAKPVITVLDTTLTYAPTDIVTYGDIKLAAGVTASDDVDGDITSNVTIKHDNVIKLETDLIDLSTANNDYIYFDVSDSSGYAAATKNTRITVSAFRKVIEKKVSNKPKKVVEKKVSNKPKKVKKEKNGNKLL